MAIVVGIDEVGRGAWAGPLVVGATMLGAAIPDIMDSKLLSKLSRWRLAKIIHSQALATGLGFVSAKEVDDLGLTAATSLACAKALEQINMPYGEIIIDGSINYLPREPLAKAMVKADAMIPAVSAASIIAKVARDEYMAQLAKIYPSFGFEKHVGYGTAAHRAALRQYGLTPSHRKSFKPIQALL